MDHKKTRINKSISSFSFSEMSEISSLKKIGQYTGLELIGEGGLAKVYKAFDTKLQRTVAIKILRKGIANSETVYQRFMQEIKIQANINIEGCVKIFDWGEKDGCTYCAMEYIEGKSLRKLFEENKLSLNDKINYLNKIIFIISKLHEHGFEHRDIKPGNFIIDNKNNVHLLDFGLAKALNKDTNIYTTTYGEFFGTPAYMSPENINSGENPTFDKSSDIYSFGVMAYEILTGKLPYEIEHLNMDEVKYLIQNEKPEPIKKICPNLIHEIANAIDKSLSKNPSVRPTATELLKSFNASENHFNSNSTKYISPVEYSTHSINKKKISKKLLYISAACLIAIAVIIFGLFITYHPTNKEKVISAKILDIKNFTIPTLNIEMIRIPTGNFNMRSMDNQYIFISNSYFISSHEITIGQYLKTPLKLPKNINTDKINQPIRNISWYDAVKFCKLLTAKEKEAGRLPQGYEYRLPTEAEWEYAASAGSKEIYYHGSMPERLSLYAVFNTGEINNIKSKKPNKFGLYDTLGNVWEWCYDSEGEKSILARINPVKKGKRYSNKIIRGGSAAENAENTTLKTRRSISPNTHNTKIGFRIVLGKKLEE